MKWWDWLGTLPQGQATFLGSFVGLFALLVAALVNAHLNRRRDDRLFSAAGIGTLNPNLVAHDPKAGTI
jgi:hypothetical protein